MRSTWIHALATAFIARRQIAAALVAAVALTVVAAQVRGSQAPFMPPAGWTPIAPPKGILGVWVHPGDTAFRQNIVVSVEKTSLSTAAYGQHDIAQLQQSLAGFRLGADQATTTCGRSAHYLSYAGLIDGHEVLFESMSTIINGVAWSAIYSRLMTQPSLPEARQALTTLCGEAPNQNVQPVQQQQQLQATPTPSPAPQSPSPEPNPYGTL
ncbi:MAG TPA: hypothetical protein VKF82_09565 [Candidatus Eremiobacteraceae bacterium]|nr:hypothetical protein [Candidatus Eremiobacteraceae bacterium]